jgi:amidase
LEGAGGDIPLTHPYYRKALRLSRELAQRDFDGVMRRHRLDAIVAPTFVRSWPIDLIDGDPPVGNGVAGPSNAAGYPNLTVPAGFIDDLPVGISFLGRAWQEPRLLRLAYAFEQAIQARRTAGLPGGRR